MRPLAPNLAPTSLRAVPRPPTIALALLGMLLTAGGCQHHHHYYYGGTAIPVTEGAVSTVVAAPPGSVCEVAPLPAAPGAVVVAPRANQNQVLISQPQGRVSRGSRFSWRKPDPESVASTRIEGGLAPDTTLR